MKKETDIRLTMYIEKDTRIIIHHDERDKY